MLNLFPLLPYFNLLIAVGGLVLFAFIIVLNYDLLLKNGQLLRSHIHRFIWPLILLTSVAGVVLSLIYSEIFLVVPCSLCWLQRIALYPQAILAVIAYSRGDTVHFPVYGIALSIFGMVVATYQYVYQMVPAETRAGVMPCLADGSADCADKVIDMFGFVTFPFVSAVTFAFLIALYQYLRRTSK